ncbi:hypothetical protein HID58_082067, partial [Brassica napus]
TKHRRREVELRHAFQPKPILRLTTPSACILECGVPENQRTILHPLHCESLFRLTHLHTRRSVHEPSSISSHRGSEMEKTRSDRARASLERQAYRLGLIEEEKSKGERNSPPAPPQRQAGARVSG